MPDRAGRSRVLSTSDFPTFRLAGEARVRNHQVKRCVIVAAVAASLVLVCCRTSGPVRTVEAEPEPELKFLVIGCGPYSETEVEWLGLNVGLENDRAQGEFLVHLGDVIAHGTPATAEYHERIAGILRSSHVPTFVVPGDNEWTEQEDPEQAWDLWTRFFMKLHRHWDGEEGRLAKMFAASEGVRHQPEREENFAFVRKGVLLIGINLPGGTPHDAEEWGRRLPANAHWIAQNFERYGDQVRAAVIFAQTQPLGAFTEPLRAASKAFGKPVLYLHADFHRWEVSRPWPEQNFLKVQTDQLGIAPPLLVTVGDEGPEPFRFDRERRPRPEP